MDVGDCHSYTESQMAILLRMTNDVCEGYPARRAEDGYFLRSPLSIPSAVDSLDSEFGSTGDDGARTP